LNIRFSLSGRGIIIFGTIEGSIITMTKQLDVNIFELYDIIMSAMTQFKNENIIVAAGHESSNPHIPIIKILRLDKMDEPNMRPLAINLSQYSSNVTAMAVHEGTNSLVVGLSGGEVLYFKHDILKTKNEKPRLIHQAQNTITGVAFKNVMRSLLIYVATEYTIITITLAGKDKDEKRVLSADGGVKFKCWTLTDKSQLIVARRDAVFLYEHDSIGPCYPFEGEKRMVHWFRGKLVIVAKENQASSSIAKPSSSTIDMTTVSIYDIENRYVGFSGSFSNVVNVICEWGSVYVLTQKGEQLIKLTEKDTQSKLEILFKKNLYQMAIDLAQSSQYDEEGVVDIIRQYADHLYSKGDFDKSITQYMKTIGHLEPSYIIRKFLDSQRIVNLTDYLQELHKQKLANEDHTTLLLNCYTKLKEDDRLNAFLMQENIDFDVDTTIKVLRQSGYYKQALQLCEKHVKHEDYLKIQLEHLKDYGEALNYMEKLDDASAIYNVKKYGKLLITNIPDKAVEFLKRLCSKTDSKSNAYVANPTDFIHIFLRNSIELMTFLEHILKNQISSSTIISNTLLELYINSLAAAQNAPKPSDNSINQKKDLLTLEEKEKRAFNFLSSNYASYDMNLALIICQLHNFRVNNVSLVEKL
jgi:vacuolar protein sorting-associated protein 11